MIEFKGESIIKFSERFVDDLACKSYLADLKWIDGYTCVKCGNTKYTQRKEYTRTCTRCKHDESPSANTTFHKVKFGLKKAFFITFEMVNSTKSLSASQVAKRYEITRKTAWLFMHKIRKVMKSSENHPIEGDVQVDEFTIGGKEKGKQGRSYDTKKKKIVAAVETTEEGKIKRVYGLKIDDYSSKSLSEIFEKHIAFTANVKTDKWKGYLPLKSDYSIEQSNSNNGQSLPQIHIIIHQIKSWLRTIYSWIHPEHVNSYLDEFSYRINRSIYKETIFHNIIKRVILGKHISYKEIIVAK
jgi:transposase-like protein